MTKAEVISPCLWFPGNAEEAARTYVSIFPDARIDHVQRSAVDWPGGKAGDTVLVGFTLAGRSYQGLNGGAAENARFNEAVSFSVTCKDQAEVDRYWAALSANGGEPIMCGWLKDRFGVRWQIVPQPFIDMMQRGEPDKVARLMTAMMQMVKLDIAALEAAYEGR